MKIKNLTKEVKTDRVRIVAQVIWENCSRPSQNIYFETTNKYADDLFPNPNSFLLACTLPAMRYGEQRITLDEAICPEIKVGLISAIKQLIHWDGGDRQIISIEAPIQSGISFANLPQRAAAFFSGDIDALAMLRDNRLNFPATHPRYIKDGILVDEIFQEDRSQSNVTNITNSISAIAKDESLNLIPVVTNAYSHFQDLDPERNFWRSEYSGSFLAAIAHAFAPRLTFASIASTQNYKNLSPWGSHPLIDPLYSNTRLKIRHENIALSKLEKTKLVGEWSTALKNLRICNVSSSRDNYNCGQCEQCIKTMTAFLCLGLLEQVTTFAEKEICPEILINNCHLRDAHEENNYVGLIQPLLQRERQDLIDGIHQIIRRYHEQNLQGLIQRFNRALF